MHAILNPCFGALLLAASLAAAAGEVRGPIDSKQLAAIWSAEGLRPVSARGLDLAFARPGVSLAPYRAILLKPVQVTFHKDWARHAAMPIGTRIRSRDMDRVREDLAKVVHERLAREFERGGYAVVSSPGAGVLEVEAQVVDAYLNAPDLPTTWQGDSYTTFFGEVTLVGTVRDSDSGDTLMRVFDRSVGQDSFRPEFTTRVENTFEVGIVASNWGRALRHQFSLAGLAHGRSNDRP